MEQNDGYFSAASAALAYSYVCVEPPPKLDAEQEKAAKEAADTQAKKDKAAANAKAKEEMAAKKAAPKKAAPSVGVDEGQSRHQA